MIAALVRRSPNRDLSEYVTLPERQKKQSLTESPASMFAKAVELCTTNRLQNNVSIERRPFFALAIDDRFL